MLLRYSTEQMKDIWAEKNKFFLWLLVEIAVLQARKERGEFDFDIPFNLANQISINVDEINRLEKEKTKHDVIAFLNHISPQFPENLRPFLHKGLTSYDIEDTALGIQLKNSTNQILNDLYNLMDTIYNLANKYKYTPEIGRTHGVHAEPITFGVKLAIWYSELQRHKERLKKLLPIVSFGKISGAVGMYTINPEIEEMVCKQLNLKPIPATQIVPRDIIVEYINTIANLAATIAKISTNLRLLSQTEICEVMEYLSKDQKGSSAMPHKKNPISFEQLSGLSRILFSYPMIAYDNLANCWHERSLDNSSAERIILPDASNLIHYLILKLSQSMSKMIIFEHHMEQNLNQTKGLIFSQEVMILIAEKSKLPREEAHTLVKNIALACWENGSEFYTALCENNEITKHVNPEELKKCFNLDNKLKYVDYIFEKIFK